MKTTYLTLIILLFSSCKNTAEISNSNKTINSNTTTCQLIEKEFINKIGKSTGVKELYLRCSIQDYFIKICESNITYKELKPYLNKGIEVEMEIKKGLFDKCNTNLKDIQSRTGTYVIIKKIIK
ncbi:MAG: hypothetical protein ACPGSO_04900 [Vicingaceae bacterium]